METTSSSKRWLKHVGDLLDITGAMPRPRRQRLAQRLNRSAEEALREDFEQIGRDMWRVLGRQNGLEERSR